MSRQNVKAQIEYFEKLSYMIKAGVNILEAFEILEDEIEDEEMKGAAKIIHDGVREGKRMSACMDEEIFSRFTRKTIEAGEVGGILDKTLFGIAKCLEREL
jgi:type II secretory pathway component PulF